MPGILGLVFDLLIQLPATAEAETISRGGFAAGGALVLAAGCMMFLFGLALTVFWIWTIIDAALREFQDSTEKIVWILVILFLNILGSLIYLFFGRPRGVKPAGRVDG